LLKQAGFSLERVDDLQALQWGKLMVNTGINPLTALLKVTNGKLLDSAEASEVMAAAARETAAVAAAHGIRIPYADPGARAAEVARSTSLNRSSMLQDILRGAPTEIDAICGAVTIMGEKVGVPTPVNRVLWRLVRSLATVSRGSGS
jgi:2-dehydropantoate 2-reductase